MRTLELLTPEARQMRGADVDAWKAFLVSQGFGDVGRVTGGTFGPRTRAATVAFQRRSGLQGLGMVGPRTVIAAQQRGFAVPAVGDVVVEPARSPINSRAENRATSNPQSSPDIESRRRYPWMQHAYGELGVREVPGSSRHNPRIVEYFASTPTRIRNDEEYWCSAFVFWCLKNAGITGPITDHGYDSVRARKWATWIGGERLSSPIWGCIVVFRYSHVAFYVGRAGANRIRNLGGNQSVPGARNGVAVSVSSNPDSAVSAYVWPKDWPK